MGFLENKDSYEKIKIAIQFLWPQDSKLRIYFILSFVVIGFYTILDFYVNLYTKLIVNSMTTKDNESAEFRWDLICIFFILKYIQTLGVLRDILWEKIRNGICKEIEVKIFSRIQNLSLRWHLNRKTGEVMKIMNSSSYSIADIVRRVCFSLIPYTLDACVYFGYFCFVFDVWFSLTIFIGLILYIYILKRGTEEKLDNTRKNRHAAYKMKNRSIDSLLNFETVKYFGNEKYEINAFKKALEVLYETTFQSTISYNVEYILKQFVVNLCLFIGSLICAYKVVKTNELTVGDYIMFSTYVVQLYGTLEWLGYFYTQCKTFFSDLESMFEILREPQEVKDSPNAKELEISDGNLVFKNVFFQYSPGIPVIKNVSFDVAPGSTVALVGPSGSGKSTIARLIFRFYDVSSGSIQIDGQDVKDVTQESLRKSIGVVPQDTVLFNNTIRYNIKYGKISTNDEDVEDAAKRADIHDQILTFAGGYDTEVGERGLLLSGGEKQRIALARTLLKSPKIFLFDEATSALDTQTERNIQASLNKACSNRTTIIIAHRLSTIMHSDQILVLKDGVIIERGRHEELLELNGTYASMWKQQFVKNTENND